MSTARAVTRRVLKAPEVRRAELIDAAQRLFLVKGYDNTTINDVIAATRLSKGAFYHHFRSKEDLLEAVAERVGRAAAARAQLAASDRSLGALEKFNQVFNELRAWKAENMIELRATFASLLAPENDALYYRICEVSIMAVAPLLSDIIEQGCRERVFDAPDARVVAEALLWLGMARRALVVDAMTSAALDSVDDAVGPLKERLRVEGLIVDRILGLPAGSIDLAGPDDALHEMILAWNAAGTP